MTRNHYKKLKKQGLKQIILCGRFSIELNSTTDVSNISELTVFTRLSLKNEIHKKLLFGESLKESCNREDILS